MNTLTIPAIVALLFSLAAWFGIGLPPTMTQPAVVAAAMLVGNAWVIVARFNAGQLENGLKHFWESRLFWTNALGALVAILALFGVSIGLNVDGAVEGVMAIIAVISLALGRAPQAAIR